MIREPSQETRDRGFSLRRFIPVGVLLLGLGAFFALGLHRHLTFETLCAERQALLGRVAEWGLLAGLAYTAVYVVATAFSVPGGAVLTLAGGFLFGTLTATALTVVGATLGAIGVFLAARTAFRDLLLAKVGSKLRRLEAGFRENALSYLLLLRLIPLFPFWLVNLVPAFLGVPLKIFALGTFIGIIPGTLVYASLGSGLGQVVESCEAPGIGILLQPEIILPLLALCLIALLPVAYKRIKGRRVPGEGSAEVGDEKGGRA